MDFSKNNIQVFGLCISRQWLSNDQQSYLANLPKDRPSVEWVWAEMDRVWRSLGLDNRKPLDKQPVQTFYSHPVWLMNGIYTGVDPVSVNHRIAIAEEIIRRGANRIADYGGGFAELAFRILNTSDYAYVSLIEPYPQAILLARARQIKRLTIQADLDNVALDAVIAQDVLEHVEDPIGLAIKLAKAVRPGGLLIFANCFYPVILCHLPRTFHLRHTFHWIMRALGLRYEGRLNNAKHVQVFARGDFLDVKYARLAERLSRFGSPVVNYFHEVKRT